MVPVTAALSGLAAQAVSAAHRARDAEPDGFAPRHQDWRTWQRRARLGRGLATFISVLLARAGRGKPGARGVALPAAPAGREVIGRGPDVLYVRFQREGQLISVPPHLPRLLPGLARWTSAPAPTADSI
jgi:hypothetical protein